MSGQGYHFAVEKDKWGPMLRMPDAEEILECVDELMESFDVAREHSAGGFKEWPALHRCLSDGTYDLNGGTYPFNRCFLGGRLLIAEASIVNFVSPIEVPDVAVGLAALDRRWFRARFLLLLESEYKTAGGGNPEQDADGLWEMFTELRHFYRRAAESDRAVLFYTDDPLELFLRMNATLATIPWHVEWP